MTDWIDTERARLFREADNRQRMADAAELRRIEEINATLERSVWRRRDEREARKALSVLNAGFVVAVALILGWCAIKAPAKTRADLAMYQEFQR